MLNWQRDCEQHFSLRDTFASAALTGLASRPQWVPAECVPEAYRLADAMLRERLRNGAASGCETVQSGYAESRRGPRHVTETYVKNDENATDSSTNREPVARHPQTALTDEEREAVRFFSQIDGPGNVPLANKRAATLRRLLDRLA